FTGFYKASYGDGYIQHAPRSSSSSQRSAKLGPSCLQGSVQSSSQNQRRPLRHLEHAHRIRNDAGGEEDFHFQENAENVHLPPLLGRWKVHPGEEPAWRDGTLRSLRGSANWLDR